MATQRRLRDSRTLILAGAGRAFGKIGYGECRVEDILAESEVSRGTFYKFFQGKEDVFDAIEQAFDLSFVQAMQGVGGPDVAPADLADAYIDAYLRWLSNWRDVARVMWSDPTRPRADSVKDVRASAFNEFIGLVAGLALETGLQPRDDLVYRGLLGAISEIGLAVIEMPHASTRDLQRARDAIMHILVRTLAPDESR